MSPPKAMLCISAGERSLNRVKEKQLCKLAATPETKTDNYKLQKEKKFQQFIVLVRFQQGAMSKYYAQEV
jgi:hypothetical protein